jgi:V/A-type H+-transporting ATPase subunit I
MERVAVINGYVRERDAARVSEYLDAQGHAVAVYEDPAPDEAVPVSLRNGKLFGPAQFLVKMFGLPEYFSFDPTPYLMFSFLLFFGSCFGDAVYGIMLMSLGYLLLRQVRDYVGLTHFCKLFIYAGVATFVVGVLTGSWASDLWNPSYLGEGNLLLRIKERTAVFDPLAKPVVALAIALAVGVANQFWALVLKMYGEVRQGRPLDALFDGGLWLVFLVGLLLLVLPMFVPGMPAWSGGWGAALAVVSGIGLVLTQGRKEEGLLAKALVGIVSLYGIVGTYGATSFISDVVSYSRLLALGLATVVIGWSVNFLAGLVRDGTSGLGPLSILLFVIILLVGHSFNFFMSILGSFVHSARLIFVEFFGRFYEGGAPPFQPFGLDEGQIRLVQEP